MSENNPFDHPAWRGADYQPELTGLPLRKAACEALGWRWVRHYEIGKFCFVLTDPVELAKWKPEFIYNSESLTVDHDIDMSRAPAIESDPAASEPLFLDWCAKHSMSFYMSHNVGADYFVNVVEHRPNASTTLGRLDVHVTGSTPSEARARAIVKAGK